MIDEIRIETDRRVIGSMGLEGFYAHMFVRTSGEAENNTVWVNPFAPSWHERDEATLAVDGIVHEETHQVVLRDEGEGASRGIDRMFLFLGQVDL